MGFPAIAIETLAVSAIDPQSRNRFFHDHNIARIDPLDFLSRLSEKRASRWIGPCRSGNHEEPRCASHLTSLSLAPPGSMPAQWPIATRMGSFATTASPSRARMRSPAANTKKFRTNRRRAIPPPITAGGRNGHIISIYRYTGIGLACASSKARAHPCCSNANNGALVARPSLFDIVASRQGRDIELARAFGNAQCCFHSGNSVANLRLFQLGFPSSIPFRVLHFMFPFAHIAGIAPAFSILRLHG